jgi:eukaryotic translation initiation factor 2C
MAMPMGKLADLLRPKKTTDKAGNTRYVQSDDFKKLRRLIRLQFHVTHRGKETNPKVYKVKRFIFDEKYGPKGADSFSVTFMRKNKQTGQEEGPIKIYDHWVQKYGRLGYPDLPLIETERAGIFPMEVCKLIKFQRYAYKLDPDQTSAMIKIAVSRPKQRKLEINHGVSQLKWDQDPYFRAYGVKIQNTMVISKARLLQNPEVHFGSGAKLGLAWQKVHRAKSSLSSFMGLHWLWHKRWPRYREGRSEGFCTELRSRLPRPRRSDQEGSVC